MFAFLNKGVKASMLAGVLVAVPTVANAATAMLASNDYVGISFWTISMAMVAATIFFLMEAGRLSGKWKTSMTVGALVTLIAAVHYFYMRDVWVETGRIANSIPVCRLVNHSSAADGRILLYPCCCYGGKRWHILAAFDWVARNVGGRLRW